MKNKPRIYYLQWDPALYLSKTYWLSNASDLLYRRLIDAWWINKGLPSDHKQLARYARYTDDEFNQAWPEISDHFTINGEKLDHNKLTELLEQCHINSIVRSQAGQLGGRPKSKKSNSLTNEKQMKSHIDTDIDIYTKKRKRVEKESYPQADDAEQQIHDGTVAPTSRTTLVLKKTKKQEIDWKSIDGLNLEAWDTWLDFRQQAKKAKYKTNRSAVALAKYPPDVQRDTILQSMANEWTGLFPEKIKTNSLPNEKPNTNGYQPYEDRRPSPPTVSELKKQQDEFERRENLTKEQRGVIAEKRQLEDDAAEIQRRERTKQKFKDYRSVNPVVDASDDKPVEKKQKAVSVEGAVTIGDYLKQVEEKMQNE